MQKKMVGLIPAAGMGSRAYQSNSMVPKPLFEINGKSILQRNIEIMRDKLGIEEIYIIIGHLGEMVKAKFGDGSRLNVKLEYIVCKNVDAGLAKGMYLAKDYIKSNFAVMLGDEFYLDSNHDELKSFINRNYNVVCAVMTTNNIELIKENYSVKIEANEIVGLSEKPNIVLNNFLGCGTYLFTPSLFDYIEKTKPSCTTKKVELTDVIDNIARKEQGVYPFFLKGEYRNVNTTNDMNAAVCIYRSKMIKGYKKSLIIPAYNEESSIGCVIDEFKDAVDEILVIDNCSVDRTAEIAREKGARVVTKKLRGYGDALKYGMDNAPGDIFLLVEADASFKAADLPKIMEYLKDADMVVGTRTNKEMIEKGANMNMLLRMGNIVVAKIIELFWWKDRESRFTDVGCTYRGIWKDVYLRIRDNLISTGPEFSAEMMIEILRAHKKIIEIPVTYRARMGGESKNSSNFFKITRTALRMMMIIIKKRFNLSGISPPVKAGMRAFF